VTTDNESPKEMEQVQEKEAEGEPKTNVTKIGVDTSSTLPQIKITPLFPQRLRKKNDNEKFKKFVEIVKDLKVNIPLVDVVTEISDYSKYMKDLVTKKRVIDCETTVLPQTYGAIMTKNDFLKRDDPGAFTIPCTIGEYTSAKGLCDLGESINLMPLNF